MVSEHKMPNQLFKFGALQLQQSGLVVMDFFEQVANDYGVVEDGLATDESTEGVPISRSAIELSEELFQQLQTLVNPLSDSTEYGIDLYQYLDTTL